MKEKSYETPEIMAVGIVTEGMLCQSLEYALSTHQELFEDTCNW